MHKAYRFRLYPTAERKFLLNQFGAYNSTIKGAINIERIPLITLLSVRPWTRHLYHCFSCSKRIEWWQERLLKP